MSKPTSIHSQQSSNSFVIATFDINEIVMGDYLASGATCDVHSIKAFRQQISVRQQVDESCGFARDFMARQSRIGRFGESRYVVKFLREDCADVDSAAASLAAEAKILATLDHPNIIKLRGIGIALGGVVCEDFESSTTHDSRFLVLDKVKETLQDCIETWREQDERLKRPVLKSIIDKSGLKRRHLFLERLQAAADLASAVECVHSCNYMHSDIRPGSVGFDIRGDLKLFDFDLARKVPFAMKQPEYGMEERRNDAEALPYMSPETFKGEAQNKSADVYSFAILLHEILSLEEPFQWLRPDTFEKRVIQNGERPIIDTTWPPALRQLLKRAWDPDEKVRPSMMHIRKILNDAIQDTAGARLTTDPESAVRVRIGQLKPHDLDSSSSRKVPNTKGDVLASAPSNGQQFLSTTFAAKLYSRSRSSSPVR